MDRRTVDGDLDDLTLDADLDAASDDPRAIDHPGIGDDEPTGVMAPPPKRSGTGKPPARKVGDAPVGNGRGPGSGKTGSGAAEGDTVVVPAAASGAPAAKDDADTARIRSAKDSSAKEDPPESGGAAKGGTAQDGPTVPAMPADDIWTPRSRQASTRDTGWTAATASERPRGNAFEVTDAFSAPPMPSESPAPASPSFTPRSSTTSSFSSASSGPAASSASSGPAASSDPAPTPPRQAFPRPGGTARQASAPQPKVAVRRPTSGRQAHLTVARVEPWSVMKFSFAVSVVAFVVLFVAVAVLYAVLSALGVFDSLQHLISTVTSSQGSAGYNARPWFSASRILGYTVLLGGLNIVLITAMSTIGAVIYNLTSRLIGGVEVTLREAD